MAVALQDALAESPDHVNLLLSGIAVGELGAVLLHAHIMRHPNLQVLELRGSTIGSQGCMRLATALRQHRSLNHLGLARNAIDSQSAVILIQALGEGTPIQSLDLEWNALDDSVAFAMAAFLSQPECPLVAVSLERNNIHRAGSAAIARAVTGNRTLRNLNLGFNRCDAAAWGHCLAANDTLLTLNLAASDVPSDGARILVAGLRQNKTLRSLNVQQSHQFLGAVADALIVPPHELQQEQQQQLLLANGGGGENDAHGASFSGVFSPHLESSDGTMGSTRAPGGQLVPVSQQTQHQPSELRSLSGPFFSDSLKELNLQGARMNGVLVSRAVGEVFRHSYHLHGLSLARLGAGDTLCAPVLSGIAFMASLAYLDLTGCGLSWQSMSRVGDILAACTNLHTFLIDDNRLEPRGAVALFGPVVSTGPSSQRVAGATAGSPGSGSSAGGASGSPIASLGQSQVPEGGASIGEGNAEGGEGGESWPLVAVGNANTNNTSAQTLGFRIAPRLTHFSASRTDMRSDGVAALAGALVTKTLSHLHLSAVGMDSDGALRIIDALLATESYCSLVTLDLSHNRISARVCRPLMRLFERHTDLQPVTIRGNPVADTLHAPFLDLPRLRDMDRLRPGAQTTAGGRGGGGSPRNRGADRETVSFPAGLMGDGVLADLGDLDDGEAAAVAEFDVAAQMAEARGMLQRRILQRGVQRLIPTAGPPAVPLVSNFGGASLPWRRTQPPTPALLDVLTGEAAKESWEAVARVRPPSSAGQAVLGSPVSSPALGAQSNRGTAESTQLLSTSSGKAQIIGAEAPADWYAPLQPHVPGATVTTLEDGTSVPDPGAMRLPEHVRVAAASALVGTSFQQHAEVALGVNMRAVFGVADAGGDGVGGNGLAPSPTRGGAAGGSGASKTQRSSSRSPSTPGLRQGSVNPPSTVTSVSEAVGSLVSQARRARALHQRTEGAVAPGGGVFMTAREFWAGAAPQEYRVLPASALQRGQQAGNASASGTTGANVRASDASDGTHDGRGGTPATLTSANDYMRFLPPVVRGFQQQQLDATRRHAAEQVHQLARQRQRHFIDGSGNNSNIIGGLASGDSMGGTGTPIVDGAPDLGDDDDAVAQRLLTSASGSTDAPVDDARRRQLLSNFQRKKLEAQARQWRPTAGGALMDHDVLSRASPSPLWLRRRQLHDLEGPVVQFSNADFAGGHDPAEIARRLGGCYDDLRQEQRHLELERMLHSGIAPTEEARAALEIRIRGTQEAQQTGITGGGDRSSAGGLPSATISGGGGDNHALRCTMSASALAARMKMSTQSGPSNGKPLPAILADDATTRASSAMNRRRLEPLVATMGLDGRMVLENGPAGEAQMAAAMEHHHQSASQQQQGPGRRLPSTVVTNAGIFPASLDAAARTPTAASQQILQAAVAGDVATPIRPSSRNLAPMAGAQSPLVGPSTPSSAAASPAALSHSPIPMGAAFPMMAMAAGSPSLASAGGAHAVVLSPQARAEQQAAQRRLTDAAVRAASHVGLAVSDTQLRLLFIEADVHRSGVLSVEAFRAVYRTLCIAPLEHGVEGKRLNAALERHGCLRSGQVSYDAFCAIMLALARD